MLSACAANEQTSTPENTPAATSENTTATTDAPSTAESTADGSTAATGDVSGTLSGIGASSVGAAMTGWIATYSSVTPELTVNYAPEGSSAGRNGLIEGSADFGGSDRAYHLEENVAGAFAKCAPESTALDLPVYISPIAIIFNVEGVDELNLDAATLAGIFKGDITNWNDPAIAAQNEGTTLPDQAITVVHRNDESGTTENFVEYLAAAAKDVWTYEVSGDWPSDLQSENAKGTSGVVSTASSTLGAITYADFSAVGSLGVANVKVGTEYTKISAEAAAKAVETSTPVEGRGALDMSLDLKRDTTETGSYPIILVSYHVYCSTYKDQATVDLVKAFGEYVVSADGQAEAAASAGNASLSPKLTEQATKSIESIKVGS